MWKMPIHYMKLHNEVLTLENSLSEVKATLKRIENQEVTKDAVLGFILEFGHAYKDLSEVKKKELANLFIEKIEIFHKERDNGSMIKSVTFRFPIELGEKHINKLEDDGLTSGNLIETVVLLSKENSTDFSK